MAELVSSRYADALFEAGLELNKLDKFNKDLNFVINVLDSEKDLMKILGHPKVSMTEKKDMLEKIFLENIDMEILNFLYILVDKRREAFIFDIKDTFKSLYNKHNKIMEVTAITAVKMDDNSLNNLRDTLSEKMNKKIILKNEIDSSIIGGVLLKTENRVIDGSIKGELDNIEKQIKNVSL